VLYGGQDQNIVTQADTWEWDGATWTQRTAANVPGPRRSMAMAFDEARREMVAFGGNDGLQVLGDTWTYDGVNWTQRLPGVSPPPRWLAACAFDGNCGRMMLLGGADAASNSLPAGSWTWDGLSWAAVGGTQPAARHAGGLAHDAQRGGFVAFGGRGPSAFLADTWELAGSCTRSMATVAPAVVGRTAQYRYDYPSGDAANLHFCWTLVTPRVSTALPFAIPGFPSIGLCRVDILNQLAAPATFLDGSGAQTTALAIPNNQALSGFQFDVQSIDLDLSTLTLRWSTNDVEVTVGPTAVPAASFTATPTSGNAPLVVQFTDTSTNFPTAWQWDFNNDGLADSTQQNPSWTYAVDGAYSVRLVATNFLGSGTVTRNSVVFIGPLPPTNPALNMVSVPPGTFQMGSTAYQSQFPQEAPVRQATLSYLFWIGKYEVTQSEYQAVVGSNPSYFVNAPNAQQRPVEQVSWNSAVAYCQALTVNEQAAGRVPAGYQYRLPTEAEWEYCCRAGATTEWHTGTSLTTSQANFQGVLASGAYTYGQSAAVGSYAPNAFGLHDMHGNVWEWCLDSYATYAPGSVTDPFVTGGANRVIRGGSWVSVLSAIFCRSAYRGAFSPVSAGNSFGFRVVLAPVLVP
jgi:formylglycine-generating enzyme required for sulfatase activity